MDAQALIDTAEGAHSEIENILQRMRELAVQGANDTNNDTDRTAISSELSALTAEITRIAGVTTWAGKGLIDEENTFSFQIGANTNSGDVLEVEMNEMDAGELGVTGESVESLSDAETLIAEVDAALETLNEQRAELGAYSNRLDYTVSNLTNVMNNLSAGLGRIQDADFAVETTNLAKTQILQQASTAMLAQANASKQNVLSLLQG